MLTLPSLKPYCPGQSTEDSKRCSSVSLLYLKFGECFPQVLFKITHCKSGDVTFYDLWQKDTVLPFIFDEECVDAEQLSGVKAKERKIDCPLILNSVLITTQLIYSRRGIIKLITIRSGLEEGLVYNPSTNNDTMNLSE